MLLNIESTMDHYQSAQLQKAIWLLSNRMLVHCYYNIFSLNMLLYFGIQQRNFVASSSSDTSLVPTVTGATVTGNTTRRRRQNQ